MKTPIRILLVDDNPYFIDAARDHLSLHERFDVVGTAFTGEEALAKAKELTPDIILLDLKLGNESGLAFIPILKKDLPGTKIVVVTLMGEPLCRIWAVEAGADGFLQKSEVTQSLHSLIIGLTGASSS